MPDFNGPGLLFPQPTFIAGTSTSTALNTTNTQIANIIICAKPQSGLSKIKFYISTLTTSAQIRASLQGVDSSGNADGNILASGLYTPSATGLHTVTLSNSVDVNVGDKIAIVLDNYSGSANITIPQTTFNDPKGIGTYAEYYASGTWTKQARLFVLYATDNNNVPLLPLLPYISTASYNSGSSPNEYGVRLTIPFNATIIGGWLEADVDAPANLAIYTPSGTQYTVSIGTNERANANLTIYQFYCTPFAVTANQQVIVSVIPTTSTNITAYRYNISIDTTSMPYMCPGYGYIQGVQRTGGGTWSTNNTPLIGGVIIGSITTSSGGTGGISRSRVQGRM
jgi:hypothetical protein